MYNDYQKMHYSALYSPTKPKKEYGLFEGNTEIQRGNYAVCKWLKDQKVSQGSHAGLLKIKPIS